MCTKFLYNSFQNQFERRFPIFACRFHRQPIDDSDDLAIIKISELINYYILL